jgi:hypothetical protein
MAKPLTLISSSIVPMPTIGLSAEDKADYVTAFMDEGKKYSVAGTYSLPNCKSTELMFWNKEFSMA